MQYEVRVRKLVYDFYHVEADSEKQAKQLALNLQKIGKVDSIRMKHEADYAMPIKQVDNLVKEIRDLPLMDS